MDKVPPSSLSFKHVLVVPGLEFLGLGIKGYLILVFVLALMNC